MPFATTWMDLEIIILSEVSQTEKDKYIIHIWNLIKNDINELIHKIETEFQTVENKLMVNQKETLQGGGGFKSGAWVLFYLLA